VSGVFDPLPSEIRSTAGLRVGEPFNPYKMFTGIFIPEPLVRRPDVSLGAKVCYGRLYRYGGQNGNCYPAVPTLAAEIGLGKRQVQIYLSELEALKLIRRVPQTGKPNRVEFLWHSIFVDSTPMTDSTPVTDSTLSVMPNITQGVCSIQHTKRVIKEGHLNRKTPPLTPPNENRKPSKQELTCSDADIHTVLAAMTVYYRPNLGTTKKAIHLNVSKIVWLVQVTEPTIQAPGIALLVHWAVPHGYEVRSMGYWLAAVPNLMNGPHYSELKKVLLPAVTPAERLKWIDRCLAGEPLRRYAELYRKYWAGENCQARIA
jgi:hypothetical protein